MAPKSKLKGPDGGAQLLKHLILGAERSCRTYLNLAGYAFPGYAPESFIQAGAFQQLKGFSTTHAVLEESVLSTIGFADHGRKGPLKKPVRKGRYDIVVYWGRGKPRAAIEVKSPVNALDKRKYVKDFDRLIHTVCGTDGNSIQFTSFLFLTVKKGKNMDFKVARKAIDELVDRLKTEAKKRSEKYPIKVTSTNGRTYNARDDSASGAWRITSITFSRKATGATSREK